MFVVESPGDRVAGFSCCGASCFDGGGRVGRSGSDEDDVKE